MYLLYIDNDDILHPQLLICMLKAMVCSGAYVLNGEYTIQQFNTSTKDRLISMSCDCDPRSYEYATLDVGCTEQSPKWGLDGKTICDKSRLGYQDYPPIMLRYDQDKVSDVLSPLCNSVLNRSDMAPLMRNYCGVGHFVKRAVLIPNSDALPLYFYRQHQDSIVHRNTVQTMREETVWLYNKLNKAFTNKEERKGLEKWTSFLQALVDCDRAALLDFLRKPWGTDPEFSRYRKVAKVLLQHLEESTYHLSD